MSNDASPTLCYCTALRGAARRVTGLYDDALAPLGIGGAQLGLLRAIDRKGAPTISELGRELGLERSTVGRNVRVLARQALLALDRDEGDLRASPVAITDKGRDVLARADVLWAGVQKAIADRLGGDGAQRLLAELGRL